VAAIARGIGIFIVLVGLLSSLSADGHRAATAPGVVLDATTASNSMASPNRGSGRTRQSRVSTTANRERVGPPPQSGSAASPAPRAR
jgi:hypothetical protein